MPWYGSQRLPNSWSQLLQFYQLPFPEAALGRGTPYVLFTGGIKQWVKKSKVRASTFIESPDNLYSSLPHRKKKIRLRGAR